ncbi:MAG: glycosyltransferase [Planctomycetia bacterium]|nr:glycosyltransferase [Planctomycetia bacterium]
MPHSPSASQGDLLGLERPRFGQFARQIANLRIADIEDCLAEQQQSGGQLGEILCRRGLLTHDQVVEVLKMQARWVAGAMRAEVPSGLPYPAKLSVCLPAYNEEANIANTLEGARAILPEFVRDFELVVTNDGSADRTAERVANVASRDERVRLVNHDRNRGYGAAVTTGLRAATGDLVMFTDSDGQFSLLDLPRLLVHLADNDFVIGYRLRRADKFSRLVNAWCWNRLVRLMLGVRVRDLDGAFKIFRRELIERLQLTATGACINAEIMAQCVRGGLRFAEVPVNHYPRYGGTPTGANLKVIAKAFRELPQLWQYRHAAPLAASPSTVAAER